MFLRCFIFAFLIVTMTFDTHAQKEMRPELVAELTRRARSSDLGISAKAKITESVAKYIQSNLSRNPKLKDKRPEDIKKFFTNNIGALTELGIKKSDPIREVITEFSHLLNSIQITNRLQKCSIEGKDVVQKIAKRVNESFSLCDQGKTAEEFITWQTKADTQNSYPGFFYFDQARDLNSIANITKMAGLRINEEPSHQLGKSFDIIKNQNPKEDEAIAAAKAIELRAEAYIRAVTNSFKTIALLRVLYANPPLPIKDLDDLKDEIVANCKECSARTVLNILYEVKTTVAREIKLNNKNTMSELEITKSICTKLQSRGYRPEQKTEFVPSSSDKKVVPRFENGKILSDTIPNTPSDVFGKNFVFQKPDSAKAERAFDQQKNEVNAINATIGDGWEGLLLMTPALTQRYEDNSPQRVNLDCLNVNNPRNSSLIQSAVAEARYAPLSYVKDVNQFIDFSMIKKNDVMEQIATLTKENKRAIGEALLSQPDLVPVACNVAGKIDHEERMSEARSLAWTWGAIVVGGALELTGVFAPLGAWVQGAIITTVELTGGAGLANEMYTGANDMELEASSEYLAAMAIGGDGDMIIDAMAKKEKADNLRTGADITLAFSALNTLRLIKSAANAKTGIVTGTIEESADDIILQNFKKNAVINDIKQINETVYLKTIPTVEEAGSISSIEAKIGKTNSQKLTRYTDALDAQERKQLLNAIENSPADALKKIVTLPCFANKVSTKCLNELKEVVQTYFPSASLVTKKLSQKIGPLSDDLVKAIDESHLSQMELNVLTKNLPAKKLNQKSIENLREYLEYISNKPLKKRLDAIKDSKLIVKEGSTPSVYTIEFKKFQSEALKKEEKWFSKEVNRLKKESEVASDEIEALARENVKAKRLAWQKRAGACRSSQPSQFTKKGLEKFIKFQQVAGPAYTATSYVLNNLNKEKDAFWFKKLGWELITSIIYGRIPKIILKNKMDNKTSKIIKDTLLGMTVGFADAQLYSLLIKQNKIPAELQKILDDPEAKKALIELAQKTSEITESEEFKKLANSNVPDASIADSQTYDDDDDDDDDDGMEEVFSDQALLDIYKKAVLKEPQKKGMISTGNPGNDLFIFNYSYGLAVGTPKRYFTQQALKRSLCMGNLKTTIAIYSLDKLLSGRLYYIAKEAILGNE